MSCGRNPLALKIRLMKYVAKNKDWHCRPTCFGCEYWETCYYEMLCEEGEIEERYEYEYRVRTEYSMISTVDYHRAIKEVVDKRNLGLDPILERRPIYTNLPWTKLI